MYYKNYKIFPTEILLFKQEENEFDLDVPSMIQDIEEEIQQQRHIDNGAVPVQSYSILWKDDIEWCGKQNESWKNLQQSFIRCCEVYCEVCWGLSPEKFAILHTNSWFYKTDSSLWKENPHNHFPATLSGIFYLKLNGGDKTVFYDPRNVSNQLKEWVFIPETQENYWCIFPSHAQHSSMGTQTDLPRYVIAADAWLQI